MLRFLTVAVLAIHTLLVAGYTAPKRWVPPLWRAWSVALVRPLFHQGWDLFAPDPPRCACTVEAKQGQGAWSAAEAEGRAARRMARHLIAYLGGGEALPDTLVVPPRWAPALRSLFTERPPLKGPLALRAVQRCMDDPARPWERRSHHVQLEFATPVPP